MLPEPIVLDTARRHGISDEDVLHARRNSVDVFSQDDDMTIHIGAGCDGTLLEVGEIVTRFEQYEPRPEDRHDPKPLHRLRDAVAARAGAERAIADSVVARGEVEAEIADAVRAAREAGHTWSAIAVFLGGSAQAAQQRYGALIEA